MGFFRLCNFLLDVEYEDLQKLLAEEGSMDEVEENGGKIESRAMEGGGG